MTYLERKQQIRRSMHTVNDVRLKQTQLDAYLKLARKITYAGIIAIMEVCSGCSINLPTSEIASVPKKNTALMQPTYIYETYIGTNKSTPTLDIKFDFAQRVYNAKKREFGYVISFLDKTHRYAASLYRKRDITRIEGEELVKSGSTTRVVPFGNYKVDNINYGDRIGLQVYAQSGRKGFECKMIDYTSKINRTYRFVYKTGAPDNIARIDVPNVEGFGAFTKINGAIDKSSILKKPYLKIKDSKKLSGDIRFYIMLDEYRKNMPVFKNMDSFKLNGVSRRIVFSKYYFILKDNGFELMSR